MGGQLPIIYFQPVDQESRYNYYALSIVVYGIKARMQIFRYS
jgi:hypothetical protein